MLRRFESYAFRESTTPEQVAELARVLRRTSRFIPEVLFSAVGKNESDANAELVWEHAYDGPDAYARYMCHPYHICMLDRYLLPESPECITAPRPESMLGLLGYEIEGAPFRRSGGIRRLVAMKAAPDVDAPDGWTHLWEQAYGDEPAMRRALTDERAVLDAGPIEGWVDMYYRLDTERAADES